MRLVIIGAGPTGLGAAHRWQELTGDACVVLEASNRVGGLARSFTDAAGFTWDLGSHLQFSHYEYFDRVLDAAIPQSAWHERRRSTWIWFGDRFIPYPFQANIHRLTPEDQWTCVHGLLDRPLTEHRRIQFEDWCRETLGDGITRLFMRPYNEKLWATPLRDMSSHWISERVSVPDLREVLRSVCLKEDNTGWGPNAVFRYPRHGGTGFVWDSVAQLLAADIVRLRAPVTTVDVNRRVVTTDGGESFSYDALLSTVPINALPSLMPGEKLPDTEGLRATQTHIVGIGLEGSPPPQLNGHCWSYFPQADIPFYRMTVLSHLSPGCVPDPDRHWSMMLEVSERKGGPLTAEEMKQRVLGALKQLGFLQRSRVRSVWHQRLSHGYPIPTLNRDRIVTQVHSWLEERNVFSRGRFGTWKYEISNQDHCFMQGVELVDRLLVDGDEPTLNHPDLVNSRYNPLPVDNRNTITTP